MYRRRWFWLAVVFCVAASVMLPPTALGRRTLHAVARKVGLIQPPPPPPPPELTWDELLEEGYAQYAAQVNADKAWQLVRLEYPDKAKLLAEPDKLLVEIRKHLCDPENYNAVTQSFYLDLLLGLGPEAARANVRAMLPDARCFKTAAVRDVLVASFSDAELEEMALTQPTWVRDAAFELVKEKEPEFVAAYLLQPRNQTAHVIEYDVGLPAVRQYFSRLTREGKLTYIHGLGIRSFTPNKKWPGSWAGSITGSQADDLRELVASETDPAIIQEVRYRTGDIDGLMASLERDGAFPGNWFWRDTAWEKAMAEERPDSFVARGIRAYQRLAPGYLSEIWQMTLRGRFPHYDFSNRYINPDAEIPALLDFLSVYGRHETADDAAFRLARCYEIKGQYADALKWFYAVAHTLPDGEYAGAAGQRILWILDAETTPEELAALEVPAELKGAVAYSLALRMLRAGRFVEALAELDRAIAAYGEEMTGAPAVQRDKVAHLVELAGQTDPESRYALAATMFHDPDLFSNALAGVLAPPDKGGGWGGPAVVTFAGDVTPAVRRYEAESNHWIQAAQAFAKVAGSDVPREIAARAAYSRALSLAKLLTPTSMAGLWRPEASIAAESAALFEQMVRDYPESELAPDALLSVAYLRRDPSYFKRVVQEYPDSNAAVDAREEAFPPGAPYSSTVAYRTLTLEQAPPAVAEWARSKIGARFAGTLTEGEFVYALVTAEAADAQFHMYEYAQDLGSVKLSASVLQNRSGGSGYALAELPSGPYAVSVELAP